MTIIDTIILDITESIIAILVIDMIEDTTIDHITIDGIKKIAGQKPAIFNLGRPMITTC
jgi:hypothetical protein